LSGGLASISASFTHLNVNFAIALKIVMTNRLD